MAGFPCVGDLFGRYRIDDRIGQGGMGVVFLATDPSLDRRVALKVVSAELADSREFRSRFEREASVLARLRSPHVIEILAYGVQDGCPYIATEYVAGGDLGALLRNRGALPPPLAALLCAQLADALHHAHSAGVVHRDVKPSNVLLRDPDSLHPHAYLCDFGIARTEANGLTDPGSVAGTWAYLSPECGRGARGTPASDIYALGCLLWAILTGTPPYGGSDVQAAIAHQQSPIPQLAGTGDFVRRVNAVLRRSLAKEPRHRYAEATRMRDELMAAAATWGGPAPRRRRTGAVLAGACAAALVIGGAALAVTRDGGDDPPRPEPEPVLAGPVSGDLNGDGYGDLAVTLMQPSAGGRGDRVRPTSVTWLSDGEALTLRSATRVEDGRHRRVAGDFDGDGGLDVLEAMERRRASGLRVTGRLTGGDTVSADLRRPKRHPFATLYPGDADGDGDDDLVMGSVNGEGYRFLISRSDGAGAFSRPRAAADVDADFEFSSVEVGDYNGDGRADVAVLETAPDTKAPSPSSTLSFYLGTGSGFRADGASRPFTTGYGPWAETGDFDGDGADEVLVVPEDHADRLTLTVVDLEGGPTSPAAWGVLDPVARDARFTGIGVADFNGDGLHDVVSIDPASAGTSVTVALSDGEQFGPGTEWARWPARGPTRRVPRVLGNTFP